MDRQILDATYMSISIYSGGVRSEWLLMKYMETHSNVRCFTHIPKAGHL